MDYGGRGWKWGSSMRTEQRTNMRAPPALEAHSVPLFRSPDSARMCLLQGRRGRVTGLHRLHFLPCMVNCVTQAGQRSPPAARDTPHCGTRGARGWQVRRDHPHPGEPPNGPSSSTFHGVFTFSQPPQTCLWTRT